MSVDTLRSVNLPLANIVHLLYVIILPVQSLNNGELYYMGILNFNILLKFRKHLDYSKKIVYFIKLEDYILLEIVSLNLYISKM